MATNVNILTQLPQGYILSSALPIIEASVTGADAVSVILAQEASDWENAILDTTLYPFNNRITVHDISQIIEEDMRRRNVVVSQYELQIGSAILSFEVVYCDYIAEGFDAANSFLTTLPTQRVYKDSAIPVTKVGNDSGMVYIRGLLRHEEDDVFSDDKHNRYEHFEAESEDDIVPGEPLSVPFYDWQDRYTSYNDSDGVALMSAVICNGNRTKTLYFMPGSPDIRLVFKNVFNAYECIDLKGLLTEKTKVSQETANIAGKRVAYNRRTEKEYEFVTEGLLESEAMSIDQLLNAHEVWVFVNGKPTRIIITDHTCEVDNNNETQPSIKFTWMFADRKPHLNAELLAESLQKPGVFTKEFTYHFS